MKIVLMKKLDSVQHSTIKMAPSGKQGFSVETCLNPWNGKCLNTDISLYIMYKGNCLPICRKCWEIISSNDVEWVYD
ncbi:MAG: hypothetical protein QXI71_00380 [Candidatus Bathyarchaeia archaeon]|nr:hypothetical protein [Candidatus Bathyarchaeota archaeon]